jgi:tetratricopeptide (TPR) repeat protein
MINEKENKDLLIHLSIIAAFALISLGSCSTTNYQSYTKDTYPPLSASDIKNFASKLRPHRQDHESLYQQACYMQSINKHRRATQLLEEAILSDPASIRAYNALGVSYDHEGDFSKAIEAYKKALALDPNIAYVQNNLGYSYFLKGDLEAAITAFQAAVALDTANTKYHNNLGLAYAENGMPDHALAEFTKAGGKAQAHNNLGRIFFRMARYEEAQKHFSIASSLDARLNDAQKGAKASTALADIMRPDPKLAVEQPQTPYMIEIDGSGKKTLHYKIDAASPSTLLAELSETPVVAATTDSQTVIIRTIQENESSDLLFNEVEAVLSKRASHKSLAAGYKIDEKKTHFGRAHPDDALNGNHSTVLNGAKTAQKVQKPSKDLRHPNSFNNIAIEVSNGNGVHRMARRVGEYLKSKGIEVTRLTNAKHFDFSETIIFYDDIDVRNALDIADQLPGYQIVKKSGKFDRPNIKVKVLIGKDLVPQDSYISRQIESRKSPKKSMKYQSRTKFGNSKQG